MKVHLDDITIRTELRPGDIGNVVWLHGHLYGAEYNYGVAFEAYVATGINLLTSGQHMSLAPPRTCIRNMASGSPKKRHPLPLGNRCMSNGTICLL